MNGTTATGRRRWIGSAVLGLAGLFVAGLLLALAWRWHLGGAGAPPQPLVAPAAPASDYVGSDACTQCHAEIAQRYQNHPMAHSLAPVLAAEVVEDYERNNRFMPSEARRYEVQRNADGVFHHEVGLGVDRQPVFDQRVPIRYALGSGRRGRSYVLESDGYLFLSPISWFSQSGRWDLSPDYHPDGHPRFEREASDRCLQCHAGRLNYAERPGPELAQRYADPPFLEASIGCERCHGPGGAHVAFRRNPSPVGTDPIVNPAHLDPPRRDAVCLQCHLQGEHQVLRYGRAHADFRPGDHLGEVWSVFVDASTDQPHSGPAVSQAEQMRSSVCYQKSAGRLGCIACHDPHTVPEPDHRVAWFRDACLACHANQGCSAPDSARQARGDSCIDCHMPPFPAEDVPHTTQTDHRLRRDPQVQETASGRPARLAEPEIFDLRDCPLTEIELQRARGLMLAEQAEWLEQGQGKIDIARQAVPLLARAAQAAGDDTQVLDRLALCQLLAGDPAQALHHWRQTLRIDPRHRDALFSLAVYFHNQGEMEPALDYLERYLAVFPSNAEMHGRHSHALSENGKLDEAIAAAERSMERDPSRPRTYHWLAQLYLRRGDRQRSESYRRAAAQMP